MSEQIYLVGDDGELLSMKEEPYEAESLLQRLLAKYPDLLAGGQMRPTAPRRWLLVSRELAVPGDESESGRWSLDHLFIDQEGVPTLVEVKRSSNTQIRREVVGQMLDYAANGTVYWSLQQITTAYERRCERDGIDPDEAIERFLGTDSDLASDEFWQSVKTNLQAGRVRLVFVADRIPSELRRIIEFLNDQMDPAEVLGVEVPQFVGEGQQALVPRVVGVSAEAERRKTVGRPKGRHWDEDSFMDELARQRSPEEVELVRRILSWAGERDLDMKWGSGAVNGSFGPKYRVGGVSLNMFSVYTDYNIQLSFGGMKVAPFDGPTARSDLADRIEAAVPGTYFSEDSRGGYPFMGRGRPATVAEMEAFIEVWDWCLDVVARRVES